MEITMKTLLTLTAVAAAFTASAGMAETTVVQTQPSTTVTTVESDPNTTGGGALGGATTGAVAGAVVGGPVGAAIGGAAGAIMGDIGEDAMTPETRTYIMENRTESVVLDSDLAVGTVVPETAPIQTVPNSNVQYVYVNDRPVVVEPETRKVIYIYE
jgi:outer membrane lipoprotein SlyB